MARRDEPYVLPFDSLGLEHLESVGGKNASLGELTRALAPLGVRVPEGFALTTAAFTAHVERAGIGPEIRRLLADLDVRDVAALAVVGAKLRSLVGDAPLPAEVAEPARAAYLALAERAGDAQLDVAVRSSATAEDLPQASFAGQHESVLGVRGWPSLERAIRVCLASLYTDRALAYRAGHGIPHASVRLSVGVQRMVRADLGSAGVIFTLDTESGFRDVVLVTGAYGLGESVVQGLVDPDEFWVHKPTLRAGFAPVLRRVRGTKALRRVYAGERSGEVREEQVPLAERERFVLEPDEVLELARWAVAIEAHYGARRGADTPMDIEWAKDGRSGELFVVQARPETVHSQRAGRRFERFRLAERGELLATGKSVGTRIGTGPARVIRSAAELARFGAGEVLVTSSTDPDWEPILRRAAAVVTDRGGRTCHAAIVSRELGIPCVVGSGEGTARIPDGSAVTVSCAEGDEGRVYRGELAFEREELDPASLPPSPVPLRINLADPGQAFSLAHLPCAGVGLLRIEFLVGDWIGVHPMALLHPERVADEELRRAVLERARGASSPPEFFVEQMASGVALIAAAFHPRPVLVRFSDFKSNEYANLLGGRAFEPLEANPMIGLRGASRYYDPRYREAFALECRAIRRVREDMGLSNVAVMVPFCRTLAEADRVLGVLAEEGLERGRAGLEVWVMAEIPSNVILAEEFAARFDGFSIGSNDLTQLTLGLDRDSELLAHLFDERDPAVLRSIEDLVRRAHAVGTPVGICGQAPSDHPEFARFLAELGIDSISLTPDSLPEVSRRLCAWAAERPAS